MNLSSCDRMNPFYKTNLCQFQPTCRNGDKCVYAHTPQEVRRVVSGKELSLHDYTYRTKMCDYGDVCIKEDCGYAHSKCELRKIPCRYQSFCKAWATCRYSHFFSDGASIFAPPMMNDSAASKTKRAIDAAGQRIECLSTDIDRLDKEQRAVCEEMASVVEETLVAAREMKDVEDDIRDTVAEIDEMIDLLAGKKKTRVMKSWADEDEDEDDDEKPQKRMWSSLF